MSNSILEFDDVEYLQIVLLMEDRGFSFVVHITNHGLFQIQSLLSHSNRSTTSNLHTHLFTKFTITTRTHLDGPTRNLYTDCVRFLRIA